MSIKVEEIGNVEHCITDIQKKKVTTKIRREDLTRKIMNKNLKNEKLIM